MTRTVDLETVLDDQPVSSPQIVILLLCAVALLLDGFDLYLVGAIGPVIAAHFGVAPAALSLIFLLQQVGLAAGAYLIGPVSDRAGRKRVLLGCTAAYGVLTLAASLGTSLLLFSILRGLAGLFLAGVIPNAVALLVESTPRRRQGMFVSIAFTGYGAGSVGGAAVGALLLHRFGWRSGFLIGGAAPLVFLLLAARLLPESMPFLRRRNPADPAIRATLDRLCPALRTQALTLAPPPVHVADRGGPLDIFRDGRGWSTAVLWAIYVLTSGTIALTFAWMPTFFVTRGGLSLETYSRVASVSLIGALAGTLAIGQLLDRLRSTRLLMAIFALLAVSMQVLGHARFGTLWFPFALMALSLFQGSGQTGMSATTAKLYPARMRSTGIGWAFGAGRIGGVIGPLLGGAMLAARFTVAQFFEALAVPMLLTVLLLAVLDRTSRTGGTASNAASASPA